MGRQKTSKRRDRQIRVSCAPGRTRSSPPLPGRTRPCERRGKTGRGFQSLMSEGASPSPQILSHQKPARLAVSRHVIRTRNNYRKSRPRDAWDRTECASWILQHCYSGPWVPSTVFSSCIGVQSSLLKGRALPAEFMSSTRWRGRRFTSNRNTSGRE
jgi:hypothetical protein